MGEYLFYDSTPEAVHTSCEDYRAAATIDLEHGRQDRDKKITCPLLVLWAENGLMDLEFDVIECWKKYAINVDGKPISSGHFIPEEAADEVGVILREWLSY